MRVITNSMKEQIDALRRAEQGIDTAASIQTRPELKPEIIDVLPDEEKPQKKGKQQKQSENASQPTPPALPAEPVEPLNPESGGEQP